jgi:hypothetical protein
MIAPFTINSPDERLVAIKAKVEAYDWSQPDATVRVNRRV